MAQDSLRTLIEVGQALAAERDLDRLLDLILRGVTRVVQADRSSLFLLDEARGELWTKIAQGLEGQEIRIPVGAGIAGEVAATGRLLNIAEAYKDSRFSRSADQSTGYRTRTILCVPLQTAAGRTLGVVQALNKFDGPFTREDEELLLAFAGQAAVALENATLFTNLETAHRELQESYQTTLDAMVAALDAREHETQNHSQRVARLTLHLARHVGVPVEHEMEIFRGALLHDVGKIGVPDAILLKPGPLTPEELVVMRTHPDLGYQMLKGIKFLSMAREIVWSHQEKYDGTGYPRSLRGEEIPLGARIFAVADTLDAMTHDRPYRKALSYAAARAEMIKCSGTQFDPKAVEAFLSIPEEEWAQLL
ncbi:MAG: GAF domain-containing protein [Deltaproteobacteria bacterium]|nr:GAF domain-containing protein [Deltaproteobacteria bacterium]